MTTAELTDQIKSILTEFLGLKPEEIDLDKTWPDHGADSLDQVEIVMAIEEELDIDIADEDAERLSNMPISEGILWLESKLAQ